MFILQKKKILTASFIISAILFFVVFPAFCSEDGVLLTSEDFVQVAQEGFGDPQNNAAWSMKWWRGKLYVGTVRSWFCWSSAAANAEYPVLPYPGPDPDKDCTDSPLDLPLQAEIWCYTPQTEVWERVYQSPEDIPVPKDPTKLVARDVGFRGMEVFTEPDGTEALYVFGANARRWTMTDEEEVPCPRILRTTDGINFKAISPDPDFPPCVEGNDSVVASYRSSAIYKGRLFLTGGNLQGTGILLETDDPAAGKQNLREVTTEDIRTWDMAAFNGYLYIGTRDPEGYSVLKTTAEGDPPYELIPVITSGGYYPVKPSITVVSMHVFEDRLYVGTDSPADIIRINPDDTWDLVVGKPRMTPDGKKYPLSGFENGFDWSMNVHIWRMQGHDGALYAGTADQSTRTRRIPLYGKKMEKGFGFDLYASQTGWYWTPITTDGFGDMWQMGLRTFASTPYGLFFGTCNFWGGLQIWQGTVDKKNKPLTSESRNKLSPPACLEAEQKNGAIILSWDSKQDSRLFRIFRSIRCPSDTMLQKNMREDLSDPLNKVKKNNMAFSNEETCSSGDFVEIASTEQFFYIDNNAISNKVYHYYVVAEDMNLQVSVPSNLARVPTLFPKITFSWLKKIFNDLDWKKRIASPDLKSFIVKALSRSHDFMTKNNPEQAVKILREVQVDLVNDKKLSVWHAEDLNILLDKLARRLTLVKNGVINASDLD